ncbi:MAG: hypothetical protein AAF717_16695 [Bacteroidota bacterium]
MATVIAIFLGILGTYYAVGLLFALYFVLSGAKKMDPLLANSKKGVRLLLFPGIVATWPFLLVRRINQKEK